MSKQVSVRDLDVIIAMADDLKIKATGLRNILARVHAPAPKRGKKHVLTADQEARILMKRGQTLTRKSK